MVNAHAPQPPPARNPPAMEGNVVDTNGHLITLTDYVRLWRIADAAELLARIPSEAAKMLGLEANHTSAVAQYIAEDLSAILDRTRPVDE